LYLGFFTQNQGTSLDVCKGQEISKINCDFFNSPTLSKFSPQNDKKYPYFVPYHLKSGEIKRTMAL
jgi:hypothetical protein